MTRDEIKLLVFVLVALASGALVQWWLRRAPAVVAAPITQAPQSGWTNPPYVFKSRKTMEQVADDVRRSESSGRSGSVQQPFAK